MGQFKPMVKMMTTEPTVELQLKKGGSVKKANGGMMAASGDVPAAPARGGMMPVDSPKAPSMAARRRAMMAMPAGAAPAAPIGMASRVMKNGGDAKSSKKAGDSKKGDQKMAGGGRPPRFRGDFMTTRSQYDKNPVSYHPLVRNGTFNAPKAFVPYAAARVISGNYGRRFAEGGETEATHKAEMSKMKGLEKELKSHESKPASKGHKGLKTGGVVMGQGGYKAGGIINTENQGGEYRNTKMDTAKPDHSPAKTGGVKMGNGGGYATGGRGKSQSGGNCNNGGGKKNHTAGGDL